MFVKSVTRWIEEERQRIYNTIKEKNPNLFSGVVLDDVKVDEKSLLLSRKWCDENRLVFIFDKVINGKNYIFLELKQVQFLDDNKIDIIDYDFESYLNNTCYSESEYENTKQRLEEGMKNFDNAHIVDLHEIECTDDVYSMREFFTENVSFADLANEFGIHCYGKTEIQLIIPSKAPLYVKVLAALYVNKDYPCDEKLDKFGEWLDRYFMECFCDQYNKKHKTNEVIIDEKYINESNKKSVDYILNTYFQPIFDKCNKFNTNKEMTFIDAIRFEPSWFLGDGYSFLVDMKSRRGFAHNSYPFWVILDYLYSTQWDNKISKTPIELNVHKIIKHFAACSFDDGLKVYEELNKYMEMNQPVILTFDDDSRFVTAPFLMAAIGKLYSKFLVSDIENNITINGLSVTDMCMLNKVIENVKKYNEDPESYEKNINEILEED